MFVHTYDGSEMFFFFNKLSSHSGCDAHYPYICYIFTAYKGVLLNADYLRRGDIILTEGAWDGAGPGTQR